MSPLECVQRFYLEHGYKRPFVADLAAYLKHGTVISRPDVFGMCRPVRHDATEAQLADPACTFKDPDAWFICQVAVDKPATKARGAAFGNLVTLADILPYPLEWMLFYRDGKHELKRYKLREILRLISYVKPERAMI